MKVVRNLQPKESQAFRMPYGGTMEKLYKALMSDNIGGLGRAYSDMKQIMNDILPDNPDFTIDDARAWYRRLGLYDSGLVSLEDMKAAIRQKMSWPVTPLAKQNYLFIQEQLRAAGFDVYVYPNRFLPGPTTIYPWRLALNPSIISPHTRCGAGRFGAGYRNMAINYLEAYKDADFLITIRGYRSTFFIGGVWYRGARISTSTRCGAGRFGHDYITSANVPSGRMIEFRQMVLRLKSAQMVAILFINYT